MTTTKFAAAAALIRVAIAALDFSPCAQLNTAIARELAIDIATFECANLSVPLDYTDDASDELELSLFRVAATEEPVLGNVLINFGGPGGTGAENLPAWADKLRDIIGPQWNLVSWDPRGTGKTIPFQCTPPVGFSSTTNTKRDLGSLVSTNVTETFLNVGWEYAGQFADACLEQANETGSLIGSAFVARDVMEIVDALDDGELLNYYGWSYGTALGSYIAAMFPERVGRMVLDGNLNPHDYQSGTYVDAAADIDSAFDGFLTTCFEAQEDCSFYSLVQPNTTGDLLTAMNTALAPLAKVANTGLQAYLTWLTVKNSAIQPLYFPRQWPQLADEITLLVNATTTTPPTTPNVTSNATRYDEAENAVIGIRASDATFQANLSREYLPIVEQSAQVSDSFSDVFYFSLWASARWRMPAKERYWGDFRETTNTPILYVNGQYDPVTPIVGAYNASSGFAGSVVLAHSGYGHGLLASPSRCAAEFVQQYFKDATLPANGTVCEPDASLLETWEAVVKASSTTSNGSSNGTSSSSGPGQSSSGSPGQTSSGSAPAQTGSGASVASGAFAATIGSAVMLVCLVFASL
ncbi:hypothetical protein LTR09_012448 [Extremus antarcticus]|uniref:Peptidase S33 tripeptidyl aminopeptidase-like C-terminal domain-containing protein n=1 Tax=Extremus antarcticus TaxID=702011 RepID=A0AAJ0G3T7_9PEZI|nr:hypothetical protein LTR09_012448 [Extremus antarcticus]